MNNDIIVLNVEVSHRVSTPKKSQCIKVHGLNLGHLRCIND